MVKSQKPNTVEEAILIKKVKEGDTKAFGKLITRYHNKIYMLGIYLTGDHAAADDVTQETFLKAYQYVNNFDGRSEFYTWIYRIAVNISITYLRKAKKHTSLDTVDPRISALVNNNNPATNVEIKQFYEKLAVAIDQLSPELRITLILVIIEGMPHKQVAEILGCSEGTVSWRIFQARKILREKLADLLDKIN